MPVLFSMELESGYVTMKHCPQLQNGLAPADKTSNRREHAGVAEIQDASFFVPRANFQ